jgi:hypothetical protein
LTLDAGGKIVVGGDTTLRSYVFDPVAEQINYDSQAMSWDIEKFDLSLKTN